MVFKIKRENPLPELVEISARVVESDAAVLSALQIELSIFPYEIEDDIGSIAVSFSEATLTLELQGLEIVPRSKFGRQVVSSSSREVLTETEKLTVSGKTADGKMSINGSLKSTGPDVAGEISLAKAKSASESTSLKEIETVAVDFAPVRAVGNNNWAIQSKPGEPLKGTYLDFDTLCEVTPIWGANNRSFDIHVFAKEKHMKMHLSPRPNVLSQFSFAPTQKKIAAIVLAKTLHQRVSDAPYEGAICLSYCEAEDEE